MQRTIYLLVCVVMATIPTTALAETEEIRVTPAYVREHPKEWSVKVAKWPCVILGQPWS
jgi:hypothetical protein